jgi:enterochelin esterase-like enzyme
MSLSRAGRSRRLLVSLVVTGWLGLGFAGAYVYVHRYWVYRGFPTPVTPAGVARGGFRDVHFFSPSVGRETRYLVYLPPHYAAEAARGRRFPVLYLLHGFPGKLTAFRDVDAIQVDENVLLAHHRMQPMILVMPTGLQGTLTGDTEWANTSAGRWMDFVLDVVHDVDHRFATQADRQHRGIAGDSEGAYGALNVALHHLDVFSVTESWSGYFMQTPTSVFSHASPAMLAANSPADYVPSMAPLIHRLGFRAWLYQGHTDSEPAATLVGFSQELHAAGADVRYGFFPGGHDWGLWRAQTPRMLVAASRWFAQRPGAHAALAGVGHALSPAQLQRVLARRRRHCLALRPGPGVHIYRTCRRYRARHLRQLASSG